MIRRIFILMLPMITFLVTGVARADVHDGANLFSQSAVDRADNQTEEMQHKHGKGFVVETFAKVPDDQQDQFKQLGKEAFFGEWAVSRAQALGVNGVYTLICMDPRFVEVRAGANTRARGDFTDADIDRLRQQWQSALHQKQYDPGLSQAVESVERAYTANIRSGQGSLQGQRYPGQGGQGYPGFSNGPSWGNGGGGSSGFGSLICLGIGALLLFSLIRRTLGGGGYGGYGNYGGYGGGYGYGGGGFGSGLLGGVLGGVLGNEADRWMHGGQSGGFGGSGGFNSSGSMGGSFDSGPSDAGQGFGGGSSGGDFGSSGGGGGGGGSGGSF